MKRNPQTLESALRDLEQQHLKRSRRTVSAFVDADSATSVIVDGRKLVNFCSNDYLGLSRHPKLAAAMSRTALRDGSGSGASHLVTGHGAEHDALERELAAFTGRKRALLFSTGYMANLAAITTFADRQDTVLLDKLSHASLIDGGLLAKARFRRYAHGDANAAAREMKNARDSRDTERARGALRDAVRAREVASTRAIESARHATGTRDLMGAHGTADARGGADTRRPDTHGTADTRSTADTRGTADTHGMAHARGEAKSHDTRASRELLGASDGASDGATILATDGVFSMDGDLAPLPELAKLARAHESWLIVDDAHGLGVLGATGRGTVEHFGLSAEDVPLLVGTLGKAFGAFGAFIAGDHNVIELLIQRARSYIYTTALPQPVAAATRAALEVINNEPWRRERVLALTQRFRAAAKAAGVPLANSATPIQPVLIGDSEAALIASQKLFEKGFWVTAIRPPTVPRGTARLRITFSAGHTEEQVDALVGAVCEALGERQ